MDLIANISGYTTKHPSLCTIVFAVIVSFW